MIGRRNFTCPEKLIKGGCRLLYHGIKTMARNTARKTIARHASYSRLHNHSWMLEILLLP